MVTNICYQIMPISKFMSFPNKYLKIEQIIKTTGASWTPRGIRSGAITIHELTVYLTRCGLGILLPMRLIAAN